MDSEGQSSVAILAPETANADTWYTQCIQAIKNNDKAWGSIQGLAVHSYFNSPLEEQAQIILGTGKQYWMTESSTNGVDSPSNDAIAADQLGRFLNDLNHGVDHWIFFIGYYSQPYGSSHPDQDGATKLMVYYMGDNQLIIHLKYWYFKNVMNTFDYGSIFRHSTSDVDGEMNAQKAGLVAAAAQNPDKSWTIGLVNQSGLKRRPSQDTYTADVYVEELQNAGPLHFKGQSSTASDHYLNIGSYTMVNGHLTINVKPLELITLRSQ